METVVRKGGGGKVQLQIRTPRMSDFHSFKGWYRHRPESIKNINIYINTNLVAMAFVNTILEAVHAQDTSGIYRTIPARSGRHLFFYLAEKQKSNTKECYTLDQVCQT